MSDPHADPDSTARRDPQAASDSPRSPGSSGPPVTRLCVGGMLWPEQRYALADAAAADGFSELLQAFQGLGGPKQRSLLWIESELDRLADAPGPLAFTAKPLHTLRHLVEACESMNLTFDYSTSVRMRSHRPGGTLERCSFGLSNGRPCVSVDEVAACLGTADRGPLPAEESLARLKVLVDARTPPVLPPATRARPVASGGTDPTGDD